MEGIEPFDAYAELRVSPDASADEIRQAYMCLARELHPDRACMGAGGEMFVRVQRAWELLRTPEERCMYDTQLRLKQLAEAQVTCANSLNSLPLRHGLYLDVRGCQKTLCVNDILHNCGDMSV